MQNPATRAKRGPCGEGVLSDPSATSVRHTRSVSRREKQVQALEVLEHEHLALVIAELERAANDKGWSRYLSRKMTNYFNGRQYETPETEAIEHLEVKIRSLRLTLGLPEVSATEAVLQRLISEAETRPDRYEGGMTAALRSALDELKKLAGRTT
jgi:hypothetical protein